MTDKVNDSMDHAIAALLGPLTGGDRIRALQVTDMLRVTVAALHNAEREILELRKELRASDELIASMEDPK